MAARFQSPAVAELCSDYDKVSEALDRRHGNLELDPAMREELTRLVTELEQEMLNWLDAHPDRRPRGHPVKR